MSDSKPSIITHAFMADAYRRMSHAMTMEALEKLRSGKQKTMRRSKIYCLCDACQTLASEVASKLRY